MNWFQLSVEEVSQKLKTNLEKGLSSEEAAVRLEQYGPNRLTEAKGKSIFRLILEQFNDFMIWVLIVAALIAGVILGELLDAIAILVILLLNGILGFVQTFRAEKALQALKKLAAPRATVVRNEIVEVPSSELVPGDLILLESGDKIPADCRLTEVANFSTLEAALTGESGSVSKTTASINQAESVGDWKNMTFAGTAVARGRGKAVVVETGDSTELGKIARLVQQPEEKTPLQVELKRVGLVIALVVIAVSVVVFLVGLIKGIDIPTIFLASVSLGVAAIPEGLPAIITVTLALGVQKMARKHAIVRRLHAVETLGATNYICSDKTGTITENQMRVKRIYASGELYNFKRGKIIGEQKIPEEISKVLKIAALANDARIAREGFIGDPTETALVQASADAGFAKDVLERSYQRIDEIPFESERKMMTTINKVDSKMKAHSKGAPEVIIDKSSLILTESKVSQLSVKEKEKLKLLADNLASEGYRVLGIAYKDVDSSYDIDKVEEGLTFVGMIALIDPPREEVKASLLQALAAGIDVSMITGDHANTAKSIAQEIGLLNNRRVITGADLAEISVEELSEVVEDVAVYARVNPLDKVKIVQALKNKGHIVAMTGDGVNDAPSLKQADIGVAMGITGTDVSKEASDIVLTDDNFATIISAVSQGRIIFDNLKKFINFLLSCNVSEVLTMFIGTILIPAGAIPLLPIQILWINLVTDGLPALALGVDPAEPGIMKRKPRTEEEGVLASKSRNRIIIEGILLTVGALTVFILGIFFFKLPLARVQTMVFTTLVLSQLLHSLNFRFLNKSIFTKGTFANRYLTYAIFGSLFLQLAVIYLPFVQPVFKTVALGSFEWLVVLMIILVVELAIDRVKVAIA